MNNELYHYGVIGMKWGVRRYQNEDGSLTEKGKLRYDENGNKLSYKVRLINKYTSQGLTQNEAEELATKTIKTRKVIAIASAVALTTAVTAVGVKHYKENTDQILKNKKIQNLSMFDIDASDGFYFSYDKNDNDKYMAWFSKGFLENQNKTQFEINGEMKLAGRKSQLNVLKTVFENNPEYKQNLIDYIKYESPDNNFGPHVRLEKEAYKDLKRGKISKSVVDYINLRYTTRYNNSKLSPIINNMQQILQKSGYDGMKDINDIKYSGFKTNANIFFGGTNKLTKIMSTPISNANIRDAQKRAQIRQIYELFRDLGTVGLIGSASSLAIGNAGTQTQIASNNRIVSNYRSEHPNTRLTYDEIIRNYRGS